MTRLLSLISSVIAIGVAIVVLVGLLSGAEVFAGTTNLLLQLAVMTVAVTILIGIINLLGIHLRRILGRQRGWVYSIVLVLSTLLVLVLWLTDRSEEHTSELQSRE